MISIGWSFLILCLYTNINNSMSALASANLMNKWFVWQPTNECSREISLSNQNHGFANYLLPVPLHRMPWRWQLPHIVWWLSPSVGSHLPPPWDWYCLRCTSPVCTSILPPQRKIWTSLYTVEPTIMKAAILGIHINSASASSQYMPIKCSDDNICQGTTHFCMNKHMWIMDEIYSNHVYFTYFKGNNSSVQDCYLVYNIDIERYNIHWRRFLWQIKGNLFV